MSDTRQNITLPAGQWIDLYVASSIALGEAVSIENVGSHDVYLAVQATQPLKDHDAYNIVKRKGGKLRNSFEDSGAWAFCPNQGGKLNISEVQKQNGFFNESPAFGNKGFVDFFLDVAKGNVPGHRPVRFLGHNEAVSDQVSTLWNLTNVQALPRTTPTIMTISSDSPNDTAAGTGCQQVRLTGLVDGWVEDFEDIETDGQNGVNTTKEWLAINSINGIRAGALKGNDGRVYIGTGTITAGVPAIVDNFIDVDSITGIGDMRSQPGFYTVPAGHTLFTKVLIQSVEAGKVVDVYIYQELLEQQIIQSLGRFHASQGLDEVPFSVPTPLTEKSFIDIRAKVDTASADVNVLVIGVLVDNDYLGKA